MNNTGKWWGWHIQSEQTTARQENDEDDTYNLNKLLQDQSKWSKLVSIQYNWGAG